MKKINRLRRLIKEIISEEMPLSSHLTFPDGKEYLVTHDKDVIPYN